MALLPALLTAAALATVVLAAPLALSGALRPGPPSAPYECGFAPVYLPGAPLSVAFFVVGLLFLLFDLELALLVPWALAGGGLAPPGQAAALLFYAALSGGLAFEWAAGALAWAPT